MLGCVCAGIGFAVHTNMNNT